MNLLLDRMHSELTRAHVALKEKARVDAMTGALNRDSFFAMLDLAARTNKRGTLLLADADHFKRINDSYGHHTGDEALRGISASIVSALGQQDFWGRIGGEEFAIFIDGADRFEAEYVAESIRLGVSALDIRCEDSPVAVTVSIGGLSLTGPFDPATAVREADRRLYLAKRGGRNRSVLEPSGEGSTEAA
jgi:diguanylate cyclase (GGDEF)-like protein